MYAIEDAAGTDISFVPPHCHCDIIHCALEGNHCCSDYAAECGTPHERNGAVISFDVTFCRKLSEERANIFSNCFMMYCGDPFRRHFALLLDRFGLEYTEDLSMFSANFPGICNNPANIVPPPYGNEYNISYVLDDCKSSTTDTALIAEIVNLENELVSLFAEHGIDPY
jgi:hypothetical protein